tara:strand:+ start:318 stop:2228 length:1911 start_codon:yes stop_codon:yes gene_type:complete
MHHKSELLIWDLDYQNEDKFNDIIFWSKYTNSDSDRIFSIPQLVEESANQLKTKYLSLIYDLGEAKVDGKRIIDHLLIRQNFSYWWMTLITEKCNYAKSPQIDNIIKILALEHWLKENRYHTLVLETDNDELAFSLSLLAKQLLIDFKWEKKHKRSLNISFKKRVFQSLPNIIQSPIWLIFYLVSNWSLKGVGVKEWRNSTSSSTFVSYLFNIAPNEKKNGEYKSHYWTKLTDLLDDKKCSTNWLHIYIKDKKLPSAKKARKLIESYNKNQKGKQTHTTLESFLTVPVIFLTFQDWCKILNIKNMIIKKIKLDSGYLWPLLKKDCEDSFNGIPGISNLLYFNLFERAMNLLPNQRRGCYWKENVGWEFGFISAWQSAGHEKNLIGFNAASVVFWDLRCFFDPKTYVRKDYGDLPLPDYVGVSGEVSKSIYLDGGYPKNEIIELESLRYLYLSNFSENQNNNTDKESKEKTVLVVGDFLKESTYKQLNLLLSALPKIDQSVAFIIKPHPACPIKMEDFPGLNGKLSTRSIEELINESDILYSGVITSAAIEAHCIGLPIIKYLDGEILNMSPLRGSESVYFVQNSEDLSDAINKIKETKLINKEKYFYLDPTLPKWNRWLVNDLDKNKNSLKSNANS